MLFRNPTQTINMALLNKDFSLRPRYLCETLYIVQILKSMKSKYPGIVKRNSDCIYMHTHTNQQNTVTQSTSRLTKSIVGKLCSMISKHESLNNMVTYLFQNSR